MFQHSRLHTEWLVFNKSAVLLSQPNYRGSEDYKKSNWGQLSLEQSEFVLFKRNNIVKFLHLSVRENRKVMAEWGLMVSLRALGACRVGSSPVSATYCQDVDVTTEADFAALVLMVSKRPCQGLRVSSNLIRCSPPSKWLRRKVIARQIPLLMQQGT